MRRCWTWLVFIFFRLAYLELGVDRFVDVVELGYFLFPFRYKYPGTGELLWFKQCRSLESPDGILVGDDAGLCLADDDSALSDLWKHGLDGGEYLRPSPLVRFVMPPLTLYQLTQLGVVIEEHLQLRVRISEELWKIGHAVLR